MDTFWDFIEPLVYNNNLLIKYDEFLKTQFGFKETFQVRIHDVYPTESLHWHSNFDLSLTSNLQTQNSSFQYLNLPSLSSFNKNISVIPNLKSLISNFMKLAK